MTDTTNIGYALPMPTTDSPRRDPLPSHAPIVRHRTAPNPSGCRWCGTDERAHASSYVRSAGLHLWTPPTAVQRLDRMRARASARTRP